VVELWESLSIVAEAVHTVKVRVGVFFGVLQKISIRSRQKEGIRNQFVRVNKEISSEMLFERNPKTFGKGLITKL